MIKDHLNRILMLTGILASILNILIIITLDFTVPDYNSMTQYVSEFGIIPGIVSRIAQTWWLINGTVLMLFALALNNTIKKSGKLSFLGPLFIFLYGLLDSVGSVVFPMDAAEDTLIGMLHMAVSFLGITAVIFSPIALIGRIKKDPYWVRLVRLAWTAQIFFLLIYVVSVLAFADICLSRYFGLLQRIFIYAADIWIVILGVYALKYQPVVGEN